MGIAERRRREREQRRSDILEAAKRLISRQGVEGTSMNQLAEATELNKATLYLYYRDKDDLVDAIVYEGLALLEESFRAPDRVTRSGLVGVLDLARATFDFYREHPLYFHTLNHQERRRTTERVETPHAAKGNEIAARVFERVAECFRQGAEEGSIRSDIDAKVFLALYYAQTYGVMHTVHAKEDIYKDVLDVEASRIEEAALQVLECYLQPGA